MVICSFHRHTILSRKERSFHERNVPFAKETFLSLYSYIYDLLKPYFYKVKLGFAGVYIFFLFLLKHIDCGYSLEPRSARLYFEQKYEKYLNFLSEIFHFLMVKFSVYLNRCVFVMLLLTNHHMQRAIRTLYGPTDHRRTPQDTAGHRKTPQDTFIYYKISTK